MTHTLLVIDDNTTVQRVIKLAFKDEPIIVTAMTSAPWGFAQIETNPPDIVLADKGGEVAAFLKSRPKLSHIPVVLLKGAFDPREEGPEGAEGCDDVLMKPLQPQKMIDCVKQLLRESKAPVENAPSRTTLAVEAIDAGGRTSSRNDPLPSDRDLALEQYFDQLNAAFTRTESTPPPPSGYGWVWDPPTTSSRNPTRPQQDPSVKNVPIATEQSSGLMITDELIEQVTQRVLDRLGERMTRSTATEIVSRLSRWLIVDEVARAKERN